MTFIRGLFGKEGSGYDTNSSACGVGHTVTGVQQVTTVVVEAGLAAGSVPQTSGTLSPAGASVKADVRKFSEYVFAEGDPSAKAKVFRGLGYGAGDSATLAREYELQAGSRVRAGNYTLGNADEYGQRINIEIVLQGVRESSGKVSYIRSGWMIRPDGTVTLNTPMAGFTR